jgi:hypothetical protein
MGTETPPTKGGFFRQPLRGLQAEPPIEIKASSAKRVIADTDELSARGAADWPLGSLRSSTTYEEQ